eukprot:TRINITY_DN2742_c0_g1_i1.p1 TRINITY_DN2742_c0_g1~~TRINITY_DN2742_c0_g1_i1.p1  ORF type:complete len:599 (+),score=205.01 TRINITY_DN2742_c0_g1_i1:79-1875(+)
MKLVVFILLIAQASAFGTTGNGFTVFHKDQTSSTGSLNMQKSEDARRMAMDSQGRIIIAGSSFTTNSRFEMVLWRFLPNGALDTTFGGQGYVVYNKGGAGAAGAPYNMKWDRATAVGIDNSGRYVVAGLSANSLGSSEVTVWRYKPDGTLDKSFGGSSWYCYWFSCPGVITFQNNGLGTTGAPNDRKLDQAQGLLFDSSNRIYLAGSAGNIKDGGFEAAVWRLTPNGLFDTSFGTNGNGGMTWNRGGLAAGGAAANAKFEGAFSFVFDSSNRLVVFGNTQDTTGAWPLCTWRFTQDGRVDTSFGVNGAKVWNLNGAGPAGNVGATRSEGIYTVAIDKQGRYWGAGFSRSSGYTLQLTVYRFTSSLDPDTTFGSNGAWVLNRADSGNKAGMANDLKIDPVDGSIIVTGSSNSGVGQDMTVLRFNSFSGELDASFNNNGMLYFQSGGLAAAGGAAANKEEEGQSLGIDSQGNYVIGGSSMEATRGQPLTVWSFSRTGAFSTRVAGFDDTPADVAPLTNSNTCTSAWQCPSLGVVVGVSVGVTLGLVAAVVGVFMYWRRKQQRQVEALLADDAVIATYVKNRLSVAMMTTANGQEVALPTV